MLIIGAGSAGQMIMRDLKRAGEVKENIVECKDEELINSGVIMSEDEENEALADILNENANAFIIYNNEEKETDIINDEGENNEEEEESNTEEEDVRFDEVFE